MLRLGIAFSLTLLWVGSLAPQAIAADVAALEQLGKQVFFDKISNPPRQACATCHVPENGFTAGVAAINLGPVAVPGADPHVSAGRKPSSVAYASFSPRFGDSALGLSLGLHCDLESIGVACGGGVFWDGRAEGTRVGPDVFAGNVTLQSAYEQFLGPLADQALAPFPGDVEQNVPDGADFDFPGSQAVCQHVQAANYAPLFAQAWGEPINCTGSAVVRSFKRIAVAISAYEASSEVNSFSSKRDLALASDNDGRFPLLGLTAQENEGHDLFYGKALCSQCHSNFDVNTSQGDEPEQIYTDNGFHHLGLPPNYEIANFDPNHPDFGLARHTEPANQSASLHAGFFRTPTLRNLTKSKGQGFPKAYMHNGYFKNLEDVVHFYNTSLSKLDPVRCPPGTTAAQARARDCWPAAEVNNGLQASVLAGLFGDLGLTETEEAALVAYLKTLDDTVQIHKPHPYHP